MYKIFTSPQIDKIFLKLNKKNPKQLEIILKKTKEIIENPHRYKNLKSPLQRFKRIQIDNHFVLVFSIDEKNRRIILQNYKHHDDIYKE